MGSSNPIEIFMPICVMMWSFVSMFLICEMGQMVSNHFNRFSDKIYMCDWYFLPLELQQMFVIIIMNAQPVLIRGYGNVECTRDSFKRVKFLLAKES